MSKTLSDTKTVSYWGAAWRRYRQNTMAMVGGVFVVVLVLIAVLTPFIAPAGFDAQNPEHSFEESSWQFPFGTDDLGRDMFSRILYSLQNALTVAFGAQAISLVLGLVLAPWRRTGAASSTPSSCGLSTSCFRSRPSCSTSSW